MVVNGHQSVAVLGPLPSAAVVAGPVHTHTLLTAQGVEDEQQQEVLLSLAAFMQDSIYQALRLPQFRHVQIVEVDTSEEPSEVRVEGPWGRWS